MKEVESRGGLSSAQRKSLVNNYTVSTTAVRLTQDFQERHTLPTNCLFHWLTDLQAGQTSCQHPTTSNVKDSEDFVTKLEAIDVEEEDMMVSFDVSLFTRVPVSKALRVIEDLLAYDGTRTTLLPVTSCLLPDCASPLLTSSLEATFTSQLRMRPWAPYCQTFWPTATCTSTLTRGHWQQLHWSPRCGYATWTTPLSSAIMHGDRELQSFLEHLNGQCAESQLTIDGEGDRRINSLRQHPCEKVLKQTDHQCVQETHPHGSLPPLQLTPPSKVKSGITKPNGFVNGDLVWQMKKCMSKRFSWQMGTRSKQLRRSGGGDKMDAVAADQGSECFCNTSRELVRRSVKHASHWVYRLSPLPEIPSLNPSQKWKEDQGWWTWRVWCSYSISCAECSATYVGETGRTLRVCMAEHRRPGGQEQGS